MRSLALSGGNCTLFSLPLAELCQWKVAPEETIMNRLEDLVVVNGAEGKAFICSLDHKLKEFFFRTE